MILFSWGLILLNYSYLQLYNTDLTDVLCNNDVILCNTVYNDMNSVFIYTIYLN